MNLTSVRRFRLAIGINNSEQDSILSRLVSSSSARIEDWLRRSGGIELKSRTEYLSPYADQISFSLAAYPITSITSVKIDSTGLYTGNETTLSATDYMISDDGKNLIVYPSQSVWPNNNGGRYVAQKTIQVVYTGGIAADAVQSVWSKSASTFTVGYYTIGTVSGCVGYTTATSNLSISSEVLAGSPIPGETITEYADYNYSLTGGGPQGPTGVTATLGTVTTPSLAEVAPDLVEGAEMHVMYLRRNRDRFEESSVQQGISLKSTATERAKDFFSITEVRDMLWRHKDRRIGRSSQR